MNIHIFIELTTFFAIDFFIYAYIILTHITPKVTIFCIFLSYAEDFCIAE